MTVDRPPSTGRRYRRRTPGGRRSLPAGTNGVHSGVSVDRIAGVQAIGRRRERRKRCVAAAHDDQLFDEIRCNRRFLQCDLAAEGMSDDPLPCTSGPAGLADNALSELPLRINDTGCWCDVPVSYTHLTLPTKR